MDFNLISDAINMFGFPVLMVAYFMYDRAKTITPMINAVNNNTLVISKLADKIEEIANEGVTVVDADDIELEDDND